TLSAASSTMQQEVLQELCENIEISYHTNNLPTTNSAPDTEMSSFFDDRIEPSSFSPIDTELQIALPLLTKQARIFLGIPVTSVPSERLFSDADNTITDKHNRLSTDTIHDLLFLKENSKIIN
ncbi:14006_t:CDS:2, partial [Cetraspora pellucida]